MSAGKSTAPGQALGYVFQFQRATYRLLTADAQTIWVGVEDVDDVSVHREDGALIVEQDKCTVGEASPLTDLSVALWKTLSIWVGAAIAGEFPLASTEFHLVTSGVMAETCLAKRMHAADTVEGATSIADELREMVSSLRDDLKPFGAVVSKASPLVLAQLIVRVFAFDNVSQEFGGPLNDVAALKLLGLEQRYLMFDACAGWVRRKILDAARAGAATVVSRQEFDRELQAVFRQIIAAPLTLVYEPVESEVDLNKYRASGFFQQLDWIETEAGLIRQSVINFVQARAMRTRWTDDSLVSESALRTYQRDLEQAWGIAQRRVARHSHADAVDHGQSLLDETLSEDSSLNGQQLPKSITAGNFHMLADFEDGETPRIGWHPEFRSRAAKERP